MFPSLNKQDSRMDPNRFTAEEQMYLNVLMQHQQHGRVPPNSQVSANLIVPHTQHQQQLPPTLFHGAQQQPHQQQHLQPNLVDQSTNHLLNLFARTQSPYQIPTSSIQYQIDADRHRPSILSGFGGTPTQSAAGARLHLASPALDVNRQASNIRLFPSPRSSNHNDQADVEDELAKRTLQERLDKIKSETMINDAQQERLKNFLSSCTRVLREGQQQKVDIDDDDDELLTSESEASSLIDQIYAENRHKAAASQAPLAFLMQNVSTDISRSEAERMNAQICEQTYRRSLELLPSLVSAMRIQRSHFQKLVDKQREEYKINNQIWEQKVNRYENNSKKTVRDAKSREIYEKMFVELKRTREERERNNRIERSRISLSGGGGISETVVSEDKADAEADSENIDNRARSAAIIAPIPTTRSRRFYENRNGFGVDLHGQAQKSYAAFQNAWSHAEKLLFHEKIGLYGKNFAAIAAFLPTKSVKDCVYYYYMTKKMSNYKQKYKQKRKKAGRQYKPPVMPHFGDVLTNENQSLYPLIGPKDRIVTECLICDSRIVALESINQSSSQFEPFALDTLNNPAFEFPICTKCNAVAQKNKATNRCPVVSCALRTGKKKPVRMIPDKFQSLDSEQKRFLIYRIKIPPCSNKCCNNCCKRILKDIESLLCGELYADLDAFKNRQLKSVSVKKDSTGSDTIVSSNRRRLGLSMLEEEEPEEKLSSPDGHIKAESFVKQEHEKKYMVVKMEATDEETENLEDVEEFNNTYEKPSAPSSKPSNVHDFFTSLNAEISQKGSLTQGTPIQLKTDNVPTQSSKSAEPQPFSNLTQRLASNPNQNISFSLKSMLGMDQSQSYESLASTSSGSTVSNVEELASHVLSYFGISAENEGASSELSKKLLERPDVLNLLQQYGIFKNYGLAFKTSSAHSTAASLSIQQLQEQALQSKPATESASSTSKRPYPSPLQGRLEKAPVKDDPQSGLATALLSPNDAEGLALPPTTAQQHQQLRAQQQLQKLPLLEVFSAKQQSTSKSPLLHHPPTSSPLDISLAVSCELAKQSDLPHPSKLNSPAEVTTQLSGDGGGILTSTKSLGTESVYESLSEDSAEEISSKEFLHALPKQDVEELDENSRKQTSTYPCMFFSVLNLPDEMSAASLEHNRKPLAIYSKQPTKLVSPPITSSLSSCTKQLNREPPSAGVFALQSTSKPHQQPSQIYEPISDDE